MAQPLQRRSSLAWGTGVPAPFDLKVVSANPQSREKEGGIFVCKFKAEGVLLSE